MASTVNDMNYEKLLHEELQASLEEEDSLWRQRARVRWLAEGNHNTAYYQAIVKSRRTKNSLSALEHEGMRINDAKHIRSICDDFFCALLSSEVGSGCCLNKRADCPRLLPEDNATLLLPATLDEVKRVVFSMEGNSALDPDGFPASFYQQHWSIVGHDLQQNALIDLGFNLPWVDKVMTCVSSASFVVLIDGAAGDFHLMCRGLRQGDPMSLYLFLIVMEELSRNLEYRRWNGYLNPPYIPRVGACPSLLTFVDDLIIVSRGEHRSYNEVMHALEALKISSGSSVNPHKSHAISFGNKELLSPSLATQIGFKVIDSDLPILHNFKEFLSRVGMERPNLHSQKDLLLWQNTPTSNIKTSDMWEVVRQKYDEEPWRKLFWSPHTQPRAQ
ncbi:hypothetical protein EJ110_NYTH27607 [Nymphaea thermarum]|nr:hypothetical protein EJ110_NYTH27607 [Nymphaea thermarum]